MYKEALNDIEGVEVYPLFSLFIFVVFFIVLGVYVTTMKKAHVNELKHLPFEKENEPQNQLDHA